MPASFTSSANRANKPTTRSSSRYSLNLSSVSKALADVMNKDARESSADKASKKSKDASTRRLSVVAETGPSGRRSSVGEKPASVVSPSSTVGRTTRRQSTLMKVTEAPPPGEMGVKDTASGDPLSLAPSSRRATLRPRSTIIPATGSALPKFRPRSALIEPAKKPPSPPRVGTRRRLSSSGDESEVKPAGKRTSLLKATSPKERVEKAARSISPLPQRALKPSMAVIVSPSSPSRKVKPQSRNTPSPAPSRPPSKTAKSAKTVSPAAISIPRPPSSSSSSSSLRTPRTPQTPTPVRDVKGKGLASGKTGSPLRNPVNKEPESALGKRLQKRSVNSLKDDSGSGSTTCVFLTEGSSIDSMEARDVEFLLSTIASPSAPTPALPRIRMGRPPPDDEPVTPSRPPGTLPSRSNLSYLSPMPASSDHSPFHRLNRPGVHRIGSILSWEQLVAAGEHSLGEGEANSMIIDITAPFSANASPAHSNISLDIPDSPSLSALPSPVGYGSISQILLPEVTPSPTKTILTPERRSHVDGGVVTMLRLQLASMENTAKERLGHIQSLEQQLAAAKLARIRDADELAGQVGALEQQMRNSLAVRERNAEEQTAYIVSLEEQLSRATAVREEAVQQAAKQAADSVMQLQTAAVRVEAQKWEVTCAARVASMEWSSVQAIAEGEMDFVCSNRDMLNLLLAGLDQSQRELRSAIVL